MTRILLVDDHEIFRDGLKALINDIDGFSVVGEAENGKEALEIIEPLAPDIVVTDIQMPVMDGLELTKKLHANYPQIRIVVITMMNEDRIIRTLQDAGAHGYITKTMGKVDLTEVLNGVLSGSSEFSIKRTPKSQLVKNTEVSKKYALLTKREKEILSLIAHGLTDKEIAEQVFLSPYTVITHRKNLLGKLGMSNKVELAKFAIENGFANYDSESGH